MSEVLAEPVRVPAEARRRRTFAIISHPDAGKTTLTEKFLLYGGAIDAAGAVQGKARPARRHVGLDGDGAQARHLDHLDGAAVPLPRPRDQPARHPGHRDFSEDTYRVLAAVDAAVMVLDAAKGIEPQTLKLFEVCRDRGIPLLTFVNKWDRPGREPLELLDEIEQTIGLRPTPVTWPVGIAGDLRGLRRVRRRASSPASPAPRAAPPRATAEEVPTPTIAAAEEAASSGPRAQDELALLDEVGAEFDDEGLPAPASATPVFFGSALTNFGVRLLLDALVDLAPAARRRATTPTATRARSTRRSPGSCSRCRPTWTRPPRPHRVRAGLLGPLRARHGAHPRRHRPPVRHQVRARGVRPASARPSRRRSPATSSGWSTPPRCGPATPSTPSDAGHVPGHPELRARALRGGPRRPTRGTFKQFRKGIAQLDEEGVVQVLASDLRGDQAPVLAAVGPLQFEVVADRLENEFGAPVTLRAASATRSPGAPTPPAPPRSPGRARSRCSPAAPTARCSRCSATSGGWRRSAASSTTWCWRRCRREAVADRGWRILLNAHGGRGRGSSDAWVSAATVRGSSLCRSRPPAP